MFRRIRTNNNVCLDIRDEELNVYFKLVVILYADDTVLFANNEDDFKSILNNFYNCCEQWKLNSNFS